MSKVRVASFSVSIDGFGAGARQSLQNPLGESGPEMFAWFFQTQVCHRSDKVPVPMYDTGRRPRSAGSAGQASR